MAESSRHLSKAKFIEPMLLLRSDELPDGPEWLRELKSTATALWPSNPMAESTAAPGMTMISVRDTPRYFPARFSAPPFRASGTD
jgi:hypothetical protein